jgi:hypothetical protein
VSFADDGTLAVRDSKFRRNPSNDLSSEPIMTLPSEEWPSFLAGAAVADPRPCRSVRLLELPDGFVKLQGADGTELVYRPDEWTAFLNGVALGEFELDRVRTLTAA